MGEIPSFQPESIINNPTDLSGDRGQMLRDLENRESRANLPFVQLLQYEAAIVCACYEDLPSNVD